MAALSIVLCIAIPAAFIAGFLAYPHFEAFCAGQLAEDALGHRPYGDVPALPDDFKVSEVSIHARSNDR